MLTTYLLLVGALAWNIFWIQYIPMPNDQPPALAEPELQRNASLQATWVLPLNYPI